MTFFCFFFLFIFKPIADTKSFITANGNGVTANGKSWEASLCSSDAVYRTKDELVASIAMHSENLLKQIKSAFFVVWQIHFNCIGNVCSKFDRFNQRTMSCYCLQNATPFLRFNPKNSSDELHWESFLFSLARHTFVVLLHKPLLKLFLI